MLGLRARRRRSARDGCGKDEEFGEEEEKTVPVPNLWGGIRGSFQVSRPRSLRSWVGSVCAMQHVAPSGARDPAAPWATRSPTAPLRISCAPRRANPSKEARSQKYSSAFLTRIDPGWDPTPKMELNPAGTVICTGGALSGWVHGLPVGRISVWGSR